MSSKDTQFTKGQTPFNKGMTVREERKCLYCGKSFSVIHSSKKRNCSRSCSKMGNKVNVGRTFSELVKENMAKSKIGKPRPDMIGNKWNCKENLSYHGLHSWVYRAFGTPNKCENCGSTEEKKYEWASINHSYTRNRKDWLRLCTKCHHKMDKKLIKIVNNMRGLE